MYNGQLISLKKVLWKVFNNPLTADLNYDDAAEYAIEAIRLIGVPLSFIDKVTIPPLRLVNYKAALPNDIVNIRGIKLLDVGGLSIPLQRATDIYHESISCNNLGPSTEDIDRILAGPFDPSNQGVNEGVTVASAQAKTLDGLNEYTYTAQNGVIKTSVRNGDLELSYKALACDKEGYPLVADNENMKLALEYYILFRYLEPMWLVGKLTDKAFNYVDTKKCFYMASAETSMQLQGGDHLESVMNAVNRLIINDTAFNNFYKGSGQRERIKKYH